MSNNKDHEENISDKKEVESSKTSVKKEKSHTTRIISIVIIVLLVIGLTITKWLSDPDMQLNSRFGLQEIVTEEEPFIEEEKQETEIIKALDNAIKNQETREAGQIKETDQSQDTEPKNNSLEQDNKLGVKVELSNFAPLDSEDDVEEVDLAISPYEIEINGAEYSPTVPKHIMVKNATQYREYLINAQKMLQKFENNEPYDDEIRFLKMRVIPEEIAEILEKFTEYNDLLKNKDLKPYKEIDWGIKFFDKFLKIKQVNDDYKQVDDLKNQIKTEIPMFNKFLYSDRLQVEFFGK